MKRRAVIVGVAESDLGVTPGLTAMDLMAQAARRALDDAGLKVSDVDGLFSATAFSTMPTPALAEYLGIRPRFSESTNVGGASAEMHLLTAALAIEAGLCDVALITYGSNQRSVGGFVPTSTPVPYEAVYHPIYPISMYALAARRHMHEFGTTPEQLAAVAVAARQWAALNPKAFKREPLTIDEVLGSRMVSSPLHKLDCCLVTDGGGAVVMTSEDRARDLKKKPVYLLGHGSVDSHRHIAQMPDLTVTGAAESGRRHPIIQPLVYQSDTKYTTMFHRRQPISGKCARDSTKSGKKRRSPEWPRGPRWAN